MNLLAKLFIPVTLATYLCIRYVDRPVSLFIQGTLYRNRHWLNLTSSLPDTLLILVVCISAASFASYCYRRRHALIDAHTCLLHLIAFALPVAYVVKTVLKYVCGRVETRLWLLEPQRYEFHWFAGSAGFSGFPSGHMIVFTTLFAAIGRHLPGYKPLCHGMFALLAVLLVATNYHFVGDVLCGAYIGLLIEGQMARGVSSEEYRGILNLL